MSILVSVYVYILSTKLSQFILKTLDKIITYRSFIKFGDPLAEQFNFLYTSVYGKRQATLKKQQ